MTVFLLPLTSIHVQVIAEYNNMVLFSCFFGCVFCFEYCIDPAYMYGFTEHKFVRCFPYVLVLANLSYGLTVCIYQYFISCNGSFFISGNKRDLEDQREVTYTDGNAFAEHNNMIAFHETSAKENTNVDETFTKLAKVH